MSRFAGRTEAHHTGDGGVVGNVYDKYGTRNPIARALMRGFLDAITELYDRASPRTVLEVGCGEGLLAQHLVTHGTRPERFEATDIDTSRIVSDLDPIISVREASIYELPYDDDAFELVVCCEVLEHVERPADALAELARVAARHVLVSTPWEPVWRILNMMRGRYLRDLGNTPGHVQHFTRAALERLASTRLRVLDRRRPLPWTILLGEPLR
jgi:ubiquinone/menaquinone biosynthesis C-methylase UbiE